MVRRFGSPAGGRDREQIGLPLGKRMEHQPLTVWRPVHETDKGSTKRRQLDGIRAVRLGNPDLAGARPRGAESNLFPVRRVPRLTVVECGRNQKLRSAGADLQGEEFRRARCWCRRCLESKQDVCQGLTHGGRLAATALARKRLEPEVTILRSSAAPPRRAASRCRMYRPSAVQTGLYGPPPVGCEAPRFPGGFEVSRQGLQIHLARAGT